MFPSARLHWLDLTLPTPAENLALDEALLRHAEAHGGAVLRCWEAPRPFVVVGLGNALAREVNLPECTAAKVPVLRRCTGGGAVWQGPGCLNYALILPLTFATELSSVRGANEFILRRIATALAAALGEPIQLAGDTDLTWRGCKFSGNAQRRSRTHLLFHGTLLLAADWAQLARVLPTPSRAPAYRADRTHRDFLTNLPLPQATVKQALAHAWQANEALPTWPQAETAQLAETRYRQADWTWRR